VRKVTETIEKLQIEIPDEELEEDEEDFDLESTKKARKGKKKSIAADIQISTVDAFQGAEKGSNLLIELM
jgi:hypothetical protein